MRIGAEQGDIPAWDDIVIEQDRSSQIHIQVKRQTSEILAALMINVPPMLAVFLFANLFGPEQFTCGGIGHQQFGGHSLLIPGLSSLDTGKNQIDTLAKFINEVLLRGVIQPADLPSPCIVHQRHA